MIFEILRNNAKKRLKIASRNSKRTHRKQAEQGWGEEDIFLHRSWKLNAVLVPSSAEERKTGNVMDE